VNEFRFDHMVVISILQLFLHCNDFILGFISKHVFDRRHFSFRYLLYSLIWLQFQVIALYESLDEFLSVVDAYTDLILQNHMVCLVSGYNQNAVKSLILKR
jgi:hypothetical protein